MIGREYAWQVIKSAFESRQRRRLKPIKPAWGFMTSKDETGQSGQSAQPAPEP